MHRRSRGSTQHPEGREDTASKKGKTNREWEIWRKYMIHFKEKHYINYISAKIQNLVDRMKNEKWHIHGRKEKNAYMKNKVGKIS